MLHNGQLIFWTHVLGYSKWTGNWQICVLLNLPENKITPNCNCFSFREANEIKQPDVIAAFQSNKVSPCALMCPSQSAQQIWTKLRRLYLYTRIKPDLFPSLRLPTWIILPRFSSKGKQTVARGGPCGKVLKLWNMTGKMSNNPGLTRAVRWKSCSDCKAAWVSIRLLRCLSVARDELPRAPACQAHYNNTAEPDYGWQLGTGEHVLRRTAVALHRIFFPFIWSEISG